MVEEGDKLSELLGKELADRGKLQHPASPHSIHLHSLFFCVAWWPSSMIPSYPGASKGCIKLEEGEKWTLDAPGIEPTSIPGQALLIFILLALGNSQCHGMSSSHL